MLGERRNQMQITENGTLGDRVWALRETETGRIASAKRFPQLLTFRARYVEEPSLTSPGRVEIQLPNGRNIPTDDPDASKIISCSLGTNVHLANQPLAAEKSAIDRAKVFGDLPVQTMKPDWSLESMPDYFQLKTGTFFEMGAVYLLASGSVDHLRMLQGVPTQVDRRRFRPNVYIDSKLEPDGFVEDSWLGGSLRLGGTVVVEQFRPTLWCVTSTLAQEDLPQDLNVLRATAKHHRGCLGVYGSVTRSGSISVEDTVHFLHTHSDGSTQS